MLKRVESLIATVLLASRWLMAPLYFGLVMKNPLIGGTAVDWDWWLDIVALICILVVTVTSLKACIHAWVRPAEKAVHLERAGALR
jgi:hypothetical protein